MVIIGIGNPMRHDDGVGPAAIACLEETDHSLEGEPELICLDGEPTRLLDAWRGRRRAIIVDAAHSDKAAGFIHRVEVGRDPLPPWATGNSSHSAGLAEAVALGTTLDRLPQQLIVFGVEPDDLSLGPGLSRAVAAALPVLIEQIVTEASR